MNNSEARPFTSPHSLIVDVPFDDTGMAVIELRLAKSRLTQVIGHELKLETLWDYHLLRWKYPTHTALISAALLWHVRAHHIRGISKLSALNK